MSASLSHDKSGSLRSVLPELVGGLVFVLATFCLKQGSQLNHDTSWYLISTGWWLDGARIGVDIVELNPPLAFYVTAPAVWLARLTDWDASQAMLAYVLAIWFGSLVWFDVIGARSRNVSPTRRRVMVAGACLVLFVLSIRDFAQRDFLMVLFTLPYLALVSFRPNHDDMPMAERVAIGLFATLGLALKPHFLLLPAAMTLVEVIRRRSLVAVFEAQNLAIAAGCVIYLAATFIVHPDYIDQVVPMAWMTYSTYGYTPLAILGVGLPVSVACLVALYGLSKLAGETFVVGLRLLVAALACLAIFFVQFKGWSYHLLPAASFAFLASLWVVIGLLADRRDVIRAGVVLLTAITLILVGPVVRGAPRNGFADAFLPFFRNEAGERSFLAMTTNVFVSFPMANVLGAEPVSRFPALWIIPGAVAHLALDPDLSASETEQLNAYLEYARHTTVEDFVRGVPELVIVDARADKPYFQGVAFDYLEFFRTDPEFEALWQRYRLVGTVYGFEVYRLGGQGR